MPSTRISPLRKAWLSWKTLRLPWRKRFLVGLDLEGNTFWEFRDIRGQGPGRWRRIVEYPRSVHYADVKVTPQWHQWLRHIRDQPPSLEEQSQELARQERMKMLAAEADARWAARPSVLDGAHREAPQPVLGADPGDSTSTGAPAVAAAANATTESRLSQWDPTPTDASDPQASQAADDPWKKARGGPSEDWQPEAWGPKPGARR